MEFAFELFKTFTIMMFYSTPIFIILSTPIVLIGQYVGRVEKWSKFDAFYWSCITASTVGFGDFVPKKKRSKIATLFIILNGVLLTGVIVAIFLQAITMTFKQFAL